MSIGEYKVWVSTETSKPLVCQNSLVVCPIGKCIALVNPESKRIMDLDENEFLNEVF